MRSAAVVALAGLLMVAIPKGFGTTGKAHAESLLERIFPGLRPHHRPIRHRTTRHTSRAKTAAAPANPPVPTPRATVMTQPPQTEQKPAAADQSAKLPDGGETAKPQADVKTDRDLDAAQPAPAIIAPPPKPDAETSKPEKLALDRKADPVAGLDEPVAPVSGARVEAGGPPAQGPLPQPRPDHRNSDRQATLEEKAGEGPSSNAGGGSATSAAPSTLGSRHRQLKHSPSALRSDVAAITPAITVEAAAALADAKACEAELSQRGVKFTVEPSISEGACGVLRPVAVDKLSSGIAVVPPTKVLCRTALALDQWASDVIVPAAKANFPKAHIDTIRQEGTYVCRPRSSEDRISEHARGSAIDIAGVHLSDGREIDVKARSDDTPEGRFQHGIRAGACGPFKTVLGPGTDADHATHFHLDMAARRNAATYCR
ncbi:extensin family protein [Jiella sp. MQZ9-1]|uniref:Extensin family protein n=1 Tax=Jiella flava TaxID=2816857 RepID=A0A939FWM6_9HYPH|nr:extensin family protein [Jiella flava]MBO0663338.1 extensin family protein [Jiella flava]MCD2471914.1 extensin family protein [Jiella flava]